MSIRTYFASDYPLEAVDNPYDHFLSVREVVYNIDTGEILDGCLDDDFSIVPENSFEDVYTEKKYLASLEWTYYTEGRARQVINYIARNLQNSEEVEVWHIWMGIESRPIIRSRTIPISELTADDLKELLERKVWSDTATKYEIPVQYRIVVTRN